MKALVYGGPGEKSWTDKADPVIAEDFLDMVLEGKEPVATPLAGRMSVAAGCAGAQSLRNGGTPVDIPPPP